MLRFLPVGWVGLMLGGLIAANSSTILTHLNWGASYLVHDFYRRFVYTEATEKHYVRAGRCATVLLFVGSSAMVFLLSTAKDSFNLLLQVGAGTGLLYLLRWFWWRITAWCEIVAMISSFGVAIVFLILTKNGVEFGFSEQLLIGVAHHHRLLDRRGLPRPADRSGGAAQVLREGAPLRPRLAAHSGEGQRRRSGRRQYPAGAHRLDHGMSP